MNMNLIPAPLTGDYTPIGLYIALFATAAAAIIVLLVLKKKKDRDDSQSKE